MDECESRSIAPKTVIEVGTKFTDKNKVIWILQDKIADGIFGQVHLTTTINKKTTAICKVSAIHNGTLACETQFYIKCANIESIRKFKDKYKLRHLGIPEYITHAVDGVNRYLVIGRLGDNLFKLLRNGAVTPVTSLKIGILMLHILEYIHSKSFLHLDINNENVMCGYGNDSNKIYLAGYSLGYFYKTAGDKLKDRIKDRKYFSFEKLLYCPIDLHEYYTPSRRSDVEMLGYNILEWIIVSMQYQNMDIDLLHPLPWTELLTTAKRKKNGYHTTATINKVKQLKKRALNDPMWLMRFAFSQLGEYKVWTGLANYFEHVSLLEYETKPNYRLLQQCLCDIINTISKDAVHPYTDVKLHLLKLNT